MSTTLKDIIASQNESVITSTPGETLHETAVKLMEHRVGALPVLQDGDICGIFSERDLVTHAANRTNLDQTLIAEVMTRHVITAEAADDLIESIKVMANASIHHLPVLSDGKLVGIVSMRDLVQAAYAEDEQEIEYLNEYIYGP